MSYPIPEPSLGKHPRDETPEEAQKPNERRSRKRANNKVAARSIETEERERLANRFAYRIAHSHACNSMLRKAGNIELLSIYQGQSLRSVKWANESGFIVLSAEVSDMVFRMMGGIVPGVMVKDEENIRMAIDETQLDHLWNHIEDHKFSRLELMREEADLLAQRNVPIDQIQNKFFLLSVVNIPQGFTRFILSQQKAAQDLLRSRHDHMVKSGLEEISRATTQTLHTCFPPGAQTHTTHNRQNVNPNEHQRQNTPTFHHNPGPIHVRNGTQGQHLQPLFPPHPQNGTQGQYLQMNPSFPPQPQNHSMMQPGPSQAYSGIMQPGPPQSYSVLGMTQDSRIPANVQRIPQYAHGAMQMRNMHSPSGLAAAGNMHQMGAQPTYGSTSTTPISRPLSAAPAVPIRVQPPPPMLNPVNSAPQSSRSISSSSGYNQTLPAPPVLVPGNMQTPQTWRAKGTEHQQPRTRLYTPNPPKNQAHVSLPTVQIEQAPNGYGQHELSSVQQEPPVQSFEAKEVAVQEGVTPSYLTTDEAQLDATAFDYGFDFDAFVKMPTNDNAVAGSSTDVGTVEGADPGAYTLNSWNTN